MATIDVDSENLDETLKSTEVVHHINGDKLDNGIDNLAVMTQTEHMREHKPLSFCIDSAESLIKEGLTLNEVAKKLNVNEHTIDAAFSRRGVTINSIRGIPRGMRKRIDTDYVIKLIKERLNLKQVGKIIGVERHAISKRLKNIGTSYAIIRSG